MTLVSSDHDFYVSTINNTKIDNCMTFKTYYDDTGICLIFSTVLRILITYPFFTDINR